MDNEHISIRKLAKETGVSAYMIHKIRSAKNTNISLNKFVSLLSALH